MVENGEGEMRIQGRFRLTHVRWTELTPPEKMFVKDKWTWIKLGFYLVDGNFEFRTPEEKYGALVTQEIADLMNMTQGRYFRMVGRVK